MRTVRSAVWRWAAALAVLTASAAAVGAPTDSAPQVVALDGRRLAESRDRVRRGDPALAAALRRLRAEADEALSAAPLSVTQKQRLPPSGDRHDYLSQAPYYWPNPNTRDGLPYLNRDGELNPESKADSDSPRLGRLCTLVETLAQAWYFTGADAYAAKAAKLLAVWFLDPATRMNPNLEYAQGIPGVTTGRGIGIIDTHVLIRLVDAVALLNGARAWTPEAADGVRRWFGAYLDWMLNSKNGQDEARAPNNHGTWYLAQAAAFALASGNGATGRREVQIGRSLLARQIEPDGSQPGEIRRTKSLGYSVFNLTAWFTLARIGRTVGVNLYAYRTRDGRSLRSALDFVAPYYTTPASWPYRQIEPIGRPYPGLAALLREGALVWGEPAYERRLIPDSAALASERLQLLWPSHTP